MTELQIRAVLDAFETEFGVVSEADGFLTEMKSGCIGCCDGYKCTFAD